MSDQKPSIKDLNVKSKSIKGGTVAADGSYAKDGSAYDPAPDGSVRKAGLADLAVTNGDAVKAGTRAVARDGEVAPSGTSSDGSASDPTRPRAAD